MQPSQLPPCAARQCLSRPARLLFLLLALLAGAAPRAAWAQPTVSGFSPASGPAGSNVTVTGSGFTNVTSVRFGELSAAFTVSNSGQLTAVVPRAASTQLINVTTTAGSEVSATAFATTRSNILSYALVANNFAGVSVTSNAAPAVGDLDGNGRLDLLVGRADGTIDRYEQTAVNGTAFTSVGLLATSNGAIDRGSNATVAIVDTDSDGQFSVLLGAADGFVYDYEQTAVGDATFVLVSSNVGSISTTANSAPSVTNLDGDDRLELVTGKADGIVSFAEQNLRNTRGFTIYDTDYLTLTGDTDTAPFCIDLDGNGLVDVLIGVGDGTIYHFEQGTANNRSLIQQSSAFNGIDVGSNAKPCVTDIDGDGLLDLLLGRGDGTIDRYEQAPNTAPTALALNNSTVTENMAAGSRVGTFSTTDVQGGPFTYTLVSGGADNGSFSISGSNLTINASPDFEVKNSYAIRVRTTDPGGLTYERAFTIFIIDAPEVPTVTSFTPTSGLVGANNIVISGTHFSDAGALTVQFNGTTATTFTVNSNTQLTATVPSGATTGRITVTNADGTGTSPSDFTVTPTNTAPTDISLSTASVAENQPVGTPVGTFATTDAQGGSFTYLFAAGGPDNGRFNIVGGNTLTTNRVFDYETQTFYSIRIRSTDQGGLSVEKNLAITVTDVAEVPTVTGFTPTSGPVGTSGIVITGTHFDDADAPTVRFNGTEATAITVDSNTQLTATVPAGATTGPISVTNSDGTGTSSASFTVVVPAPNTTIVSGPPAIGNNAIVSFQFSSDQSPVEYATSGAPNATYSNNGATPNFGPIPDGSYTLSVAARNTSTNVSDPTPATYAFTIDTQRPATTVTSPAASSGGSTGSAPIPFVITFSETVTDFDVPGVTVTGGTFTASAVSGSVYNVTVTPSGPGSLVTVRVAANVAHDAAGNPNTASNTYSISYTPVPVVTSLTPSSGPVGTTVVVAGSNFTAASTVSFNGTAASSVVVNSSSQLTAVVAAGTTTGPFTVTTAGGVSNNNGTFTVTAASTSTALSSSANPSAFGQSVTFTATVSNTNGSATPTGTVTFRDGSTTLGTGSLTAGAASFTTSALASGSYAITAAYGATTSFNASTSAALTQVVNAPANQAPVLTVPATQTTARNTALVFSTANGNALSVADADAGSGLLSVYIQAAQGAVTLGSTTGVTFTSGNNGGGSFTFSGTLANINNALNGLSFSPNSGFTGAGALRLDVNDQGNTGSGGARADSETLTINVVVPPNQAPVVTVPAAQTTIRNTALVFSTANGNALSVADADAGSGQLSIYLQGTQGAMTLSTTAGLTFTSGSNGGGSFTFTGTLANVNNALNGLSFSPNSGFTGAAALQLTVNDQGNTGTGGAKSDSETVAITVAAQPTTTIVSGPPTVSQGPNVSFVFSSDQSPVQYVTSSSAPNTTYSNNGANPTFGPIPDGTYTLSVAARNTSTGLTDPTPATYTFTVDATVPTVTLSSSAGASGGSTGTVPIPYTVVFSETVTGFTLGGLTVSGGTAGSFVAVSGTQYTFSITPSGASTVTVRVNAGAAQDAAGNSNLASPTYSLSYVLAAVTATPVITAPRYNQYINTTPATPTYSGTAPAGSTVTLYLNGNMVGTTSADASGNWSLVQPTALGDNVYSLEATAQSSGEAVSARSSSVRFYVDRVPPGVPVVTAPTNGSFVTTARPTYTGTSPTSGGTGVFIKVYIDNVLVSTQSLAGSNWSYTQSTALSQGVHTVTATASDLAGNASAFSSPVTFTVDSVVPTATISSTAGASGGSTSTTPIPYTVTFSEAVTGFDLSDLTVSGGTAGSFVAVSATEYTFAVTPGGPGTVEVSVGAAAARDVATNANPASATYSLTYSPPAGLTITGLSPTRNQHNAPAGSNVAITFSQALQNTAATRGSLKVFSAQRGGRLQDGTGGTATVSGSTLTFDPTTDFRPGETVVATITSAAQGSSAALARGYAFQFTAATGGTGTGSFAGATAVAAPVAGSQLADATLADVSGDGHLDLLTTDRAGSVIIQFGTGTGTFGPGSSVAVGSFVYNVVTGDLDGDGDLDLATANYDGGTVSIRLNNGSGTFTGTTEVPVGRYPFQVQLADVDGDGDLDLLAANDSNDDSVSIRLNDGTGSFGGSTNVPVGETPVELAVGDVDGDGDLDFVTADYNGHTVSLRLNNGNGTFSNGTGLAPGASVRAVALADVDGDGDLDLLAALRPSSGSALVAVRLNDGTGAFSGTQNLPLPQADTGLALGDVDHDGDLDLVVPTYTGSGGIALRLNDGSGIFGGTQVLATTLRPTRALLADVDDDGDLDLLGVTSQQVNLLLNQPAPLPVTLTAFTAQAQGPAVQLAWHTASELHSARFEVERSLDGKTFEQIGERPGQGTTASPTAYAYRDEAAPAGLLYYRLRQVDVDGSASYSPVRDVTVGKQDGLTVYPNPARTAVAVAGLNAGAKVEVFDALGRPVARATADAGGTAQLALPAGLAAGVYIVRSGAQARRLTVE